MFAQAEQFLVGLLLELADPRAVDRDLIVLEELDQRDLTVLVEVVLAVVVLPVVDAVQAITTLPEPGRAL